MVDHGFRQTARCGPFAAQRREQSIQPFGAVIDQDQVDDEIRVTVIATGFDKAGVRPDDVPSFTTEPRPDSERSRSQTRRTPVMDDRQRSSLEIPDDEIDIPSFLKD